MFTTMIRVGDEGCTSFTSSIADKDELHNTASTPVTIMNMQNEQVINSLRLEEKVQEFLVSLKQTTVSIRIDRRIPKKYDTKLRPSTNDDAKVVLARCGSTAQFIENESNIPSEPCVIYH